jgi:pSer/pThr/pTyr-binding forkhead associated (FHA) protein
MPKLNLILQDGTEQSHELIDDLITIGRAPDNLLQIDDASVSSHHATLTLVEGDYVFRDLGSTNGSRVRGKEVAPQTDHRLHSGDTLRLGKVEGAYESENPAEARPLPEEDAPELTPAAESAAPQNFQNASPFQTKKKKKNPAGLAVMALAALAVLAFVFAVLQIISLKAPDFPPVH